MAAEGEGAGAQEEALHADRRPLRRAGVGAVDERCCEDVSAAKERWSERGMERTQWNMLETIRCLCITGVIAGCKPQKLGSCSICSQATSSMTSVRVGCAHIAAKVVPNTLTMLSNRKCRKLGTARSGNEGISNVADAKQCCACC